MSNQRPSRRSKNPNTVTPRPNTAGGDPVNAIDSGDPAVPVAGLSIFDPVFMGTDETGYRAEVVLPYRNLLMGGEPGSGKSVALNNVVAHCALCTDVQLWGFDGKRVELGLWRAIMDRFIGPNLFDAIDCLGDLQVVMDGRYD
jgi:DNA segregation ATPase FtsK/SpoIIIE, S-DNA-T family